MATLFNSAKIRELLIKGFTEEELRGFCFDSIEFRPVYDRLSEHSGKREIVSLLLEYAERKELVGTLLNFAKEQNPARYKQYQPYYDVESYKIPTLESVRSYDISAIRKLLLAAFDDQNFTIFCFDNFSQVYDRFSPGMTFSTKIQLLIEYCERTASFDRLLSRVNTTNPQKFTEFKPLLETTKLGKEEVSSSRFLLPVFLLLLGIIVTIVINPSFRELVFSLASSSTTKILTSPTLSIAGALTIIGIIIGLTAIYRVEVMSSLSRTSRNFTIVFDQAKRSVTEAGVRRKQNQLSEWREYLDKKFSEKSHVYFDELKSIPKSKRQQVIDAYKKNKPDVVYDVKEKCLMERSWPKLKAVTTAWEALSSHLSSDMDTFGNKIVEFALSLEKALGVEKVPERSLLRFDRIIGCKVNVEGSFEGLNLSGDLLICATQYRRPTPAELEHLYQFVRDRQNASIALLLLFSDDDYAQQLQLDLDKKFKHQACDIIVVTQANINSWVKSKEPRDELRRSIVSHASLRAISPFVITGPTPDNMFFGRENELRQIRVHLSSKSFAIIGGRRVGKTSIAQRLLKGYFPAANFYAVYQDVSTITSREQFLASPIQDWRPVSPPDAPKTFSDLFSALPLNRKVALLLDETDKLVPLDQESGWPIFNQLRALTNSGHLRVILIGERALRESMQDTKSPLFNFVNELLIGRLDFTNVERLITQPMEKLEIIYDPGIVRRIYEFTSGHPNVVQRLCLRLIEVLDNRNDRKLTLDDVETVVNSPGFQKNDFLDTYLSRATLLERILVIVLSKADQKPYSLSEIRQILSQRLVPNPPAREVSAALQRLTELRSVLNHTSQGYIFAVKAIPLVINRPDTIATDDLLEEYIETYRSEGDLTL